MNQNSKLPKIIILLIIVVFFAGGVFLYQGNTALAEKILTNLKITPEPETFTELYFEDFNSLPKQSLAGHALNFTFTIHNLEGVSKYYTYVVYFEYSTGEKTILKQGSIIVDNNDYRSVNVNYVFKASNLKGKVVVNLANLNQQIDFILPNNN
jgi:hypothetical protein